METSWGGNYRVKIPGNSPRGSFDKKSKERSGSFERSRPGSHTKHSCGDRRPCRGEKVSGSDEGGGRRRQTKTKKKEAVGPRSTRSAKNQTDHFRDEEILDTHMHTWGTETGILFHPSFREARVAATRQRGNTPRVVDTYGGSREDCGPEKTAC